MAKRPRPYADAGTLFWRYRIACGLLQRDVAKYAGVIPRTVRNWEAGACLPSHVQLERLLRYLEFSAQDAIKIRRLAFGMPENSIAEFTDLQV